MSIEKAIEQRIQEAIARGEFDDLPGKGKPLDLDAYFATPEDLPMAYAMLKSNDFVPEEVEIAREIAKLKDALSGIAEDDARRSELIRKLNDRSLALRIHLENRRRRR